jgi:hypothetical protein
MNFQEIFQAVEVQSISAKNGNLNPLEVYIELKNLETFVKECKDLVQLDALGEAEKYKGQIFNGYEVDVRSVGGRYTYDHIDEIAALKAQIKDLEKAAQDSYKLGAKGSIAMNAHTGEITEPAHYKDGSTAIILKLKK